MLPSEALSREFVIDEAQVPELNPVAEKAIITTHAVLVGDIGLLLPSAEVSELVDRLSICKLPNTPEWFSGVSSLRGNMTPVFDLHEFFGVTLPKVKRRIIVVGSGETSVAFWIDGMPRVVVLDREDDMGGAPPLPGSIVNHARQFYLKNSQIWVDWDVQKFFSYLGGLL